jgi:hypothetical protein
MASPEKGVVEAGNRYLDVLRHWWQLPRIFGAVKLIGMMPEPDVVCLVQPHH